MDRHPQAGFTLLELIATLSVAAILLGLGVPSFVGAIKNSRTGTDYQRVVSSLLRARSEAVKTGTPVSVCARASDTQCGDDWNHGWLVFIDEPPRVTGAETTTIGAEDTIVGLEPPPSSDNSVRLVLSVTGGAGDATERAYLTYGSNGSADVPSASMIVCDGRGPEHSRTANVTLTGALRRGRVDSAAASGIPLDVFDRPLDCPTS